jgi:DNA-binding Lrp family transcriptional regulator
MDKLLKILEQNARLTNSQIAVMLGISEEMVEKKINKYEQSGVIKGYNALINYDKLQTPRVVALIELKVSPKKDLGFDEIAKTISEFEEVQSVYLMSGGYDLAVKVNGTDFKDIALFVSQKLATLNSVLSTATHFLLSKYKEQNVIMDDQEVDIRRNTLL